MARKKKNENIEQNLPEAKIEEQEYSNFMEKSYIDYAISVIIDRALPEVRDGLKPVQRRVLYDMYDLGILSDKPFKKCARIVGDTMGRFHPHGDSSIYGALVTMTIPWKNNISLIDGHGNFGSIDGDGAAAFRYTEARLSSTGQMLLDGINERIVPFKDNYDANEKEPIVLPTKIPQLFLNGCDGLAVAMKSYIPPHNLGELIDATILLIQKPKSTTKDLMQFVKGPDYPTGGIIINQKDLLNLYETGEGKIVIRGKVEIENIAGGKTNLVITEIPYTLSGNKTKLLSDIIDLMKNGKLNELSDARDESDENVRIVLEVKKGQDINKVLNKLYKKTKLQDNENCNFLVVDEVTPKVIGLKEYLEYFISFQEEITTNKYQLNLEKAQNRLEIVEGLLLANDLVDPIIETIRYAKNISIAKNCLITGDVTNINYKTKKNETLAKKFSFTEKQAAEILSMRLSKLNNLEISDFEKEKQSLIKEISKYEKILQNKKLLHKEIIKYLTDIKNNLSIDRKTIIKNDEVNVIVEEDAIVEEDVQVLIDRFGYMKVVDTISIARSSEDTLNTFKYNLSTKNTDKLAVFTNAGNLYQIKLIDLPRLKIKDKGQPIDVLCGFKDKDKDEEIILIDSMNNIINSNLIFVFNDGYMKKVPGSEFVSIKKLTVATKLYDNILVSLLKQTNEKTLVLTTSKKERIVDLTNIDNYKKTTKGNKWAKLTKDELISSAKLK